MQAQLASAKKILLTGASRGIGATLARVLAEPGRELFLVARTREALYGTARACSERGAKVQTFGVDLAVASQVTALAQEVRDDFGGVDLLVNNAGILGPEGLPWETDPEQWWQTQLVNVRAPYLLQRILIPDMLQKGGGRVIDLSSGAAVTDDELCSAYFTSKTALLRLAGSLDLAGRDKGILVFPVAPGVVETDMTRAMSMHIGRDAWNDPQQVAQLVKAIAAGWLDGVAGCQLRAGVDTVEQLQERIACGEVLRSSRRLRLTDW